MLLPSHRPSFPIHWRRCAVLLAAAAGMAIAEPDAELTRVIATLRQVGAEGAGSREASQAWLAIRRDGGAEEVSALLDAFSGATPLAANWLRSAVDAICESALARGSELPAKTLESYVADSARPPRARRLAFEWLARADAAAAERLLDGMLNDPSVELRRDAVARAVARADGIDGAAKRDDALLAYRLVLDAARDRDQIEHAVRRLGELGETVDVARHFGFLREWQAIGPFENKGNQGFATAFAPEQEIDLGSEHAGLNGPVKWTAVSSAGKYGEIDLNAALGRGKGVAGYAVHEFRSREARDAELRLATVNAWKLWLNGKLLQERNEYHHGTEIDHYIVPCRLEKGPNVILLKVCQNEQTEDYADPWGFQIRVCDSAGAALHPQVEGEEKR